MVWGIYVRDTDLNVYVEGRWKEGGEAWHAAVPGVTESDMTE